MGHIDAPPSPYSRTPAVPEKLWNRPGWYTEKSRGLFPAAPGHLPPAHQGYLGPAALPYRPELGGARSSPERFVFVRPMCIPSERDAAPGTATLPPPPPVWEFVGGGYSLKGARALHRCGKTAQLSPGGIPTNPGMVIAREPLAPARRVRKRATRAALPVSPTFRRRQEGYSPATKFAEARNCAPVGSRALPGERGSEGF